MTQNHIKANGKLLLTAEYFVLDGAKALALPTQKGQSLHVAYADIPQFIWQSFDADNAVWFEAVFSNTDYDLIKTSDTETGKMLEKILKFAAKNAKIPPLSYIKTQLDFPRQWGLGTSSTLIYSLAQLFNTDAYTLLAATFGGSGYDLACAGAKNPIIFWRENEQPHWHETIFEPIFAKNLYFVYLGKKQNSREGIARYRERAKNLPPQYFDDFSQLTADFLTCQDLALFDNLIQTHEKLVADIIALPRAKDLFFNDFEGEIKSLGAWGGDFVLATSADTPTNTTAYFHKKGFDTVLKYHEMV